VLKVHTYLELVMICAVWTLSPLISTELSSSFDCKQKLEADGVGVPKRCDEFELEVPKKLEVSESGVPNKREVCGLGVPNKREVSGTGKLSMVKSK
jgi:hypothetical protein